MSTVLFAMILLGAPKTEGVVKTTIGLRADVLVPTNDGFHGDGLAYGGAIGLSADWNLASVELQPFFHFGRRGEGRVLDYGITAGTFLTPLSGSFTPIIGAGLGARAIDYRGATEVTETGSVLMTRVEQTPESGAFGLMVFGRAGMIFFREASVQFIASFEYSALFVDETPQAATLSLGIRL